MLISKEIEQHFPQEEYLLLNFTISLLGAFMLIFSFLVLIYAPGKTIAKYGTVVDINDYGIPLTGDSSHVHILLDNGELVTARKPDRIYLSENKKVVLQEMTSFFGGVKRYGFYLIDGQ
jgi:hypothetical protein